MDLIYKAIVAHLHSGDGFGATLSSHIHKQTYFENRLNVRTKLANNVGQPMRDISVMVKRFAKYEAGMEL